MDRTLLLNALRGQKSVSFTLDPFAPGTAFEHTTQLNAEDVPATFHPALAFVGWLARTCESEPGELTLYEVGVGPHTVPEALRVLIDPTWS